MRYRLMTCFIAIGIVLIYRNRNRVNLSRNALRAAATCLSYRVIYRVIYRVNLWCILSRDLSR